MAAHRPQRFQIVFAEVSNGFEVGRQLAQQPDHFHIPLTLRFQQPRGTNPVQITVEIQFEQGGRIIRRMARVRTADFGETQRVQIKRGDEGARKRTGFSAAT